MNGECIEQRNGGYYVHGTRISLDSVVYAFNQGDSPERILARAHPGPSASWPERILARAHPGPSASWPERILARAHPGPSVSWPERILERYPLLGKLSKVYGAIAFYLDHQAEIDAYLEAGRREFETTGIPLSESNPALWDRLEQARLKMTS
jgi:uncharacterized protein (DUF433 family)